MNDLADLRHLRLRHRQMYRRTTQFHFDNFSDTNFKANFRFSKENEKRLTKLLGKCCLGLQPNIYLNEPNILSVQEVLVKFIIYISFVFSIVLFLSVAWDFNVSTTYIYMNPKYCLSKKSWSNS